MERIRWQPQNIFYYSRPKFDSDSFNFFQICETNSLIQLVAFDELFMFKVKYYCIPLKIFSSLQFRNIEPTWIQRSSAKFTRVELEISQLRNWKFTITISCLIFIGLTIDFIRCPALDWFWFLWLQRLRNFDHPKTTLVWLVHGSCTMGSREDGYVLRMSVSHHSMLTRSPKIMRQVNTIQEFQIKTLGMYLTLAVCPETKVYRLRERICWSLLFIKSPRKWEQQQHELKGTSAGKASALLAVVVRRKPDFGSPSCCHSHKNNNRMIWLRICTKNEHCIAWEM